MKRLALFILTLFFLVIPLSHANAQDTNWVDDDYATCLEGAVTGGEVCSGAYASHTQGSMLSDMVRRILGPVPGITVTADAWQRNPEYVKKMAQGAATAQMVNFIAMMYTNPPASTYAFIMDTAQTLGFVPRQAYAQGIGFSGLAPLLPIWKAFRNIAYLLLALVMIVIGFMVMLRKKIDPKTVVTVQNALPRIVVALLLITFSYAIVGIMVDAMYLLILLAIGLFQSAGILPNLSEFGKTLGFTQQSLYTQGGILSNLFNIFGIPTPFGNVGGTTTPTNIAYQALGINPTVGKIGSLVLILGGLIIAGVGSFAGATPVGLGIAALGALGPLIGLLIGLALLFLTIRLFIFFLNSYIQILLGLMFAPIQLVLEAVPGTSTFAEWIKNMFANLIVFPIGAVIFMLSGYFAALANSGGGALWVPPFTPLLGSNSGSISALISIGILFTIPTIAGQIKEALKPKPFLSSGVEGITGSLAHPAGLLMQGYQLVIAHRTMDAFRGVSRGITGLKPEEHQGKG
jgi:hypothetical protein